MRIVSIVSTKGGPGKTTVTANLGAFCADANLRTLLIDLDTQPSLSSFYRLDHEAPGGIYEFIAHNEIRFEQIVSHTQQLLIGGSSHFSGRLRARNRSPGF
ncbi:ParA family protein [Pseudomonas cichorii]|nr:ParA family protein [Pseudomonas cichorii]MBX8565484.1 ParA family protein [Pseudomonas cichorii]MBX8588010.1 ParA family protein [Pseudomonas cichorii]